MPRPCLLLPALPSRQLTHAIVVGALKWWRSFLFLMTVITFLSYFFFLNLTPLFLELTPLPLPGCQLSCVESHGSPPSSVICQANTFSRPVFFFAGARLIWNECIHWSFFIHVSLLCTWRECQLYVALIYSRCFIHICLFFLSFIHSQFVPPVS